MATGIIKRIPNVKNYAFVVMSGEDGPEEVFFHRTSVPGTGFDDLQPGQKVRFEIVRDPKDSSKRRAVDITSDEG